MWDGYTARVRECMMTWLLEREIRRSFVLLLNLLDFICREAVKSANKQKPSRPASTTIQVNSVPDFLRQNNSPAVNLQIPPSKVVFSLLLLFSLFFY